MSESSEFRFENSLKISMYDLHVTLNRSSLGQVHNWGGAEIRKQNCVESAEN